MSKFEEVWDQEKSPLYQDFHIGVMAVPDAYPRLPYQTLIFPRIPLGQGQKVLGDMHPSIAVATMRVALEFQRKLQQLCGVGQLALLHTEGYGVPDHAHVLVYQSTERKSGKALYDGPVLGEWVPGKTHQDLRLSLLESLKLDRDIRSIKNSFGSI